MCRRLSYVAACCRRLVLRAEPPIGTGSLEGSAWCRRPLAAAGCECDKIEQGRPWRLSQIVERGVRLSELVCTKIE